MTTNTAKEQLLEIASRIKELREIMGWTTAEMSQKTQVSEQQYIIFESANADIPFSFIQCNYILYLKYSWVIRFCCIPFSDPSTHAC